MAVDTSDTLDEAVVLTDLGGRIARWNRAAEALYGWTAAEAIGKPVGDLVALGAPELASAARGETHTSARLERRRDGTTFPARVTLSPCRGEAGELVGVLRASRQATPTPPDRIAIAVAIGRVLSGATDEQRARADVAELLCAAYADFCSIAVAGETSHPAEATVRSRVPEVAAAMRAVTGELSPVVLAAWAEARRTGEPRLISDVPAFLARSGEPPGAHARALAAMHATQVLIVPLVARGATVGLMNLGVTAGSGRGFSEADLVFAEDLGLRLGSTLELARSHAELQQSQERLELALRGAPLRVFAQDRELRYTYAAGSSAGRPFATSEAIGKTDAELFPPEIAAPLTAEKRLVMATGRGMRRVHEVVVDGVPSAFDGAIEPLRGPDGTIIGVTGTSWDVTEQRRLIAARAAAEARARELIEAAPDPYFLSDLDGRYVDVNAAACQWLGYSRAQLLAMRVTDVLPAEDVPPFLARRAAMVTSGMPARHEGRMRRADGEIADVEVSAVVVPGPCLQAFVRDITDRKRAERERAERVMAERRSRERLQALREATLRISAIEAGKMSQRVVMQRIADEARELAAADFAAVGDTRGAAHPLGAWLWSGLSAEEAALIGRHPHGPGTPGFPVPHEDRPIGPADQAAGHPPLGAALAVPILREDQPLGELHVGRRPGGAPFAPEDQALLALLAAHAAVALENARLFDEREAAVRAREELTAIVAHDLKSPLNAIELREVHLSRTTDDPRVLNHATSVRRSVLMMQRMIRDLLDASALERGKLRLDLAPHAIRPLVDEVVDVLSPVAQDREIAVAVAVPDLAPIEIDRERVLQTLYNILGNALKFTPSGGAVAVTAALRPDAVEVTVSDTGHGIAPEVVSRIFDRYFTTAVGHQGTGLGLYIARGVVEAHGGRIWVDSAPGAGSAFHFTLPRRRPSAG